MPSGRRRNSGSNGEYRGVVRVPQRVLPDGPPPERCVEAGPHVMRMGPVFGRGSHIDYDANEAYEARQYFADGKVQSIALLSQAISTLKAEIADQEQDGAVAAPELDLSKVFVVHGHDRASKAEVAGFIRKLGFEPVILHGRPNKGRALITKFREEAAGAGFAIVLMTPDDLGSAAPR
jgi:hypothetical protein